MLSNNYNHAHDQVLIEESIAGNKTSLDKLIKIHQDYIYNISLKLFLNPDDALDATQEILIKVITSLKTFKGESQFRTWLYRIAFNYFINAPKSKVESLLENSPAHFSGSLTDDPEIEKFTEVEIEEVRILCSTAMLMCLNREQRLLYIIGDIFNINHNLGAELFDLTPANYRVKLHRAKSDLLSFVSGKCGIINPENPCRCPKKTRVMIDKGFVDKNNLRFNADFSQRISEIVVTQKNEVSDKIQLDLKALFQESPFQIKKEIDKLVNELITES